MYIIYIYVYKYIKKKIYIYIRGWVLSHSFFICPFVLSCPVSFLSEYSMIGVASVSLFIICFLCLWPL